LVLSIAFLAAGTIDFLWNFFAWNNYAYAPGFDDLMYYLVSLSPALIGFILYIILRTISEGILLFMDLELDLRERTAR
jgi:hypothetical protein